MKDCMFLGVWLMNCDGQVHHALGSHPLQGGLPWLSPVAPTTPQPVGRRSVTLLFIPQTMTTPWTVPPVPREWGSTDHFLLCVSDLLPPSLPAPVYPRQYLRGSGRRTWPRRGTTARTSTAMLGRPWLRRSGWRRISDLKMWWEGKGEWEGNPSYLWLQCNICCRYNIKRMGEDGACLFRAVADQLYGDQEMHVCVRAQCMDYIVCTSPSFIIKLILIH